MKANLKGLNGIELNCDYLRTVGGMYTYFYVPADKFSADVLNAVRVDGPITHVDRNGNEWQVQVKTDMIEWED